jgi:hypothetical protein
MKKAQINKLNMFKVVLSILMQFKALTDSIPALSKAVALLADYIINIEKMQALQSSDTTGVRTDKDNLHDQLAEEALSISGALFAYACDIANNSLKSKVDFTSSDFDNCSQSEFIGYCTTIYNEALLLENSLVEQGIVKERIDEFKDAIEQYKLAITKPRESVVSHAGITDEIAETFKNADSLLKEKIDRLMFQFKQTNLDFYLAYHNARFIIERGVRHEKTPQPASQNNTDLK